MLVRDEAGRPVTILRINLEADFSDARSSSGDNDGVEEPHPSHYPR
jgi:hypothetical protein